MKKFAILILTLFTATAFGYLSPTTGGGGGSGTVTSVGLTTPGEFTVSGSPVTTSGTLTFAKATQNANLVWAGPTTGSAAQPTFRSLVAADIPSLSYLSSSLTSAHLFVGNGSNVATNVAASGDVTLANTGAFTVASVGGSTASAVNTGVALANAATDADTASTIVKRASNKSFMIDAIYGPTGPTGVQLNMSGSIIYDSGSIPSIGWSGRQLFNSSGIQSMDWENGLAFDFSDLLSISWGDRNLYDATEGLALDWSTGDLSIPVAGKGLKIKEGSNARMGIATLVGGTVVVSNTSVTANTRVFLTAQSPGGTVGALYVATRSSGTSFTITSTSALDTSVVAYQLIEPAP